jgi:hypothetical protein
MFQSKNNNVLLLGPLFVFLAFVATLFDLMEYVYVYCNDF